MVTNLKYQWTERFVMMRAGQGGMKSEYSGVLNVACESEGGRPGELR